MHRRTFVRGTAAATVAASVAGCSSVLDGGGSDGGDDTGQSGGNQTGSPKAVVEAYTTAGVNGNAEAMSDLVHPESPLEPSPSGDGSGSVDSVETTNTSGRLATVLMETTITQDGENQTIRTEFDVRRYDGEWQIYTFNSVE